MTQKKEIKLIMDTDWIFDGIVDSEQKQYVLLSYFQKLNKNLEDMKIYPMFTELSLHLGNVQTLLSQNKILYTDKKIFEYGEELLITDLKVKDIPNLSENEFDEYQKILQYSHPKLFDYFNIAKSFWAIVYDSINVSVKLNKKNVASKHGFFFTKINNVIYVWRYNTRKVRNSKNLFKVNLTKIYEGDGENLKIQKIISRFSKTYSKNGENQYPVFEIICHQIFPLNETLLPLFKRKVLSLINQSLKYLTSQSDKKLLTQQN
jgi:hypothetical protein